MGLLALGCGGGNTSDDNKSNTGNNNGDGGNDGGGNETSVPTDTSAKGIAAFIESESYKQAPAWQAETDQPRDVDTAHGVGQARVWMNETAIAGQAEDPNNLPVDSMAVKELYEDGNLVGIAAMLKTNAAAGPGSWLFFCYGPATRCAHDKPEYTPDDPLYALGLDEGCGFCHSTIITSFPR